MGSQPDVWQQRSEIAVKNLLLAIGGAGGLTRQEKWNPLWRKYRPWPSADLG